MHRPLNLGTEKVSKTIHSVKSKRHVIDFMEFEKIIRPENERNSSCGVEKGGKGKDERQAFTCFSLFPRLTF